MRKIPAWSLCVLLVLPSGAWAAIAHDATTTFTSNNSTTVGGSHTPVSTTNGIAMICVSFQRGTLPTVTGVTYGGNAATLVAAQTEASSGQRRIELWRYVGYSAGASTVTATMSAITNDSRLHVSTYTGVDQSTPLGTAVTFNTFATTASVTVTSAAGELVVDCDLTDAIASATVGAGQTQRANFGDTGNHLHLGSEEAGAASVSMDWTLSTTALSAGIGVPLKPATSTTACRLSLLGVGC